MHRLELRCSCQRISPPGISTIDAALVLSVGPVLDPVVIGCSSGCRSRRQWLSFVAPEAVVCGSRGCHLRLLQRLSFKAPPEEAVVRGSRGCWLRLPWLSFADPVAVACRSRVWCSSGICCSQLQYLMLLWLSFEINCSGCRSQLRWLSGSSIRRLQLQYRWLRWYLWQSSSICRSCGCTSRSTAVAAVVRSGGCCKWLQYLSLAAPVSVAPVVSVAQSSGIWCWQLQYLSLLGIGVLQCRGGY